MCCGTSDIGMTCLPLSMMITCVQEKTQTFFKYLLSWLAVNVLWHRWHWNDFLPLSMMNTYVHENPKYFSSTCCKSWLAVNVLWHKWHWNDLSSTLHDDHLCTWKTQIFFKCLLQKLTCSKWVVAQVTLEWLVFHSPWWTLVWMKNPYIFQLFVADVDLHWHAFHASSRMQLCKFADMM